MQRLLCRVSDTPPTLARALGEGRWTEREDQRIWSRDYALQWLRLGQQKLAPVTVEATIGDEKLDAASEELTFEVASVLDHPDTAAEVPNGLIVDPPPRAWWPFVLAAVAIGATVLLVRRWLRSRPAPEPRIPVVYALAPDQRALDRFRDIERRLVEHRIGQEELVVEVSETLRHFIQDGLGLQSVFRTSEEFLSAASTQIALPGQLALSVRGFLEQCDLVKFAAQRPSLELCQRLIATAREFVLTTRESAAPEPAEVADG